MMGGVIASLAGLAHPRQSDEALLMYITDSQRPIIDEFL